MVADYPPLEKGHPEPDVVLLWLHGLGADGSDFADLPGPIAWEGSRLRVILPHAPLRPVTLQGGMVMRAWYDLVDLQGNHPDLQGITDTVQWVHRQLEQIRVRYPQAQLFLGGFSQGGAAALMAFLRDPAPGRVAGVIGLGTYMPVPAPWSGESPVADRQIPVFLAHGYWDPILPYAMGWSARTQLVDWGYTVTWHRYWMGHQVIPATWRDLSHWMQTVCRTAEK